VLLLFSRGFAKEMALSRTDTTPPGLIEDTSEHNVDKFVDFRTRQLEALELGDDDALPLLFLTGSSDQKRHESAETAALRTVHGWAMGFLPLSLGTVASLKLQAWMRMNYFRCVRDRARTALCDFAVGQEGNSKTRRLLGQPWLQYMMTEGAPMGCNYATTACECWTRKATLEPILECVFVEGRSHGHCSHLALLDDTFQYRHTA
jgi:hypothetical protein